MTPDRRHWRPPRFSTEHTRRLGCSVESGAGAAPVRTPDRHQWRPVRLSTEHPRRLEGSVESGACAQNSNLVGVLFGPGVRVGSYCGKLGEVARGPGAVVGVRVWVVYGPGRCRFTEIQPFEKSFLVQTQGCQEVQSENLARTGRPSARLWGPLLASARTLATVTHLLATLGLPFGGPHPLGRCS